MNRFLAFAGKENQSYGGIRDLLCYHDTLEDCKSLVHLKMVIRGAYSPGVVWAHIADMELMERYEATFTYKYYKDTLLLVDNIIWEEPCQGKTSITRALFIT